MTTPPTDAIESCIVTEREEVGEDGDWSKATAQLDALKADAEKWHKIKWIFPNHGLETQ